MDLWIRSQDKEQLIKVERIMLIDDCLCCDEPQITHIETDGGVVGSYAKERALQILNEIDNKIKNQFIVKVNALLKPNDEKKLRDELEMNYNGDFIMENPMLDIKPTTQNVIYYEMPEE